MAAKPDTLQAQLSALKKHAAVHSAASMVPDWKPAPKQEEEKEKAPDIKTFDLPLTERVSLQNLVKEHYNLGGQISKLKKDQAALTSKIKKLLEKNHLDNFMVGDIPVTYTDIPRQTLDKLLLMANGVSAQTLALCMVEKPCYTLNIGVRGKRREEDE